MTITRRATLVGLGALAAGNTAERTLAEGGYPSGVGTIKVVVPFPPGGASDIIGRMLADSLTRRWGKPAILESVVGGATTTGIGRVANGPKDGSQILILSIPFVTTQFILSRLPYDPERDIVPLAQLTRQPSLLCVKKDLPVASVADFIAYAKARPGVLNYASTGPGTPSHLATELFMRMTGVAMKHVPYKGSAPAQNDLVGGHVDFFIDNAAAIIGLARANSVKALAVTAPTRSALLPAYPTMAETVPGYSIEGWFGTGVSTGTPQPIQGAIRSACLDLLKEKPTIERLASVISEPVGGTSDSFVKFLAAERARWGALINNLGLKR